MANQPTRIGTFRGIITWYTLDEAPSGAVGLKYTAQLIDFWYVRKEGEGENEKVVSEWYPYVSQDEEASGYVNLIKKDGSVNTIGVESLCLAGWDGDMASITAEAWRPNPCQFVLETKEFKKKSGETVVYAEAKYINAYDRDPNAKNGGISREKAEMLTAKYGGDLMAAASSVSRPAPPVTPPPPPPPKMSTQLQDKPQPIQGANAAQTRAAVAVNESEIPF